jgi:hypothetical protein
MKKTLSEKIEFAALNILKQWIKDNPDYPILNIVQQLNLSSVSLKTFAVEYERNYKAMIKGKTTNELH